MGRYFYSNDLFIIGANEQGEIISFPLISGSEKNTEGWRFTHVLADKLQVDGHTLIVPIEFKDEKITVTWDRKKQAFIYNYYAPLPPPRSP